MSADDRDVLTSLPRTRPTRRSAKRDTAAGNGAPAARRPRATRATPPPPVVEPEPTPPPAGWASAAAAEEDRWSLRGGGPLLRPALRLTGALVRLPLAVTRRAWAKLPKP